jgi:hypothetical protein
VGPVYGKDAIEMIDLVLQQLRPIPVQVQFVGFPLQILIPNPNVVSALDSHQQVGKREAIVPHREVLGADVHDLWIDQGPGLIHFHVNDPHRSTDLWRGDGSPAPKP